MPAPLNITALDIAEWADRFSARSLLPVLVRRLVQEAGTALSAIDFPGYDEAQRPGWDGWTEAVGVNSWVPAGRVGWELSVADDNPGKPNCDWRARATLPAEEKQATTFLFVTARRWPGKGSWVEKRRREQLWADVRAYDSEDLAQWLEQSPATRLWLAGELGRPTVGLRPLDQAWMEWAQACRPALSPKLFDAPVVEAAARFSTWREQPPHRPWVVTADSVGEAVGYVAAALPEPERERAIVVDDPLALPGLLVQRSSGLIVIAHPQAEALAATAAGSHHMLFARTHATVPVEVDVALSPAGRAAFEAALGDMGVAEQERDRLTTEAGRSPTILRRRLAIAPVLRTPDWAREPDLCRKLMPILLAGAWRAGDGADEACVAEVAGQPIEAVERDLAELTALADAPVWATAGFRGVVSRKDALFAIHHALTEQDLARFLGVAELVLTLDDPRLDLPEDKRWAAGIYGVQAEVSGALRDAVGEMLVLLAIEGDRLLGARLGSVVTRVDRVVAAVLRDPSPRRWLAQHHLRWLAEASPDTFLDAVEADLRQAEPTIFALLRPVTSTHGRCERTELLWALELLAWEPRRFARVFAILARLSEVEISDNWANKPEASLGSLVRCWLPQTAASVAERVAAMGKFAATGSPVAWRLLLAQFPRVGHASPNVRPRWREVPAGAGDGPLTTDVRTTMLGALDLMLAWPSYSVAQLGDLLTLIDEFPDEAVLTLLDRAESWAGAAADDDRATLRERLRRDLSRRQHRANGNLPAWEVRITAFADALAPTDLIEQHRWLFAEHWVPESGYAIDDEESWQRHPERIEVERTAALREVVSDHGVDGVLSLIQGGNASWVIGRLLAQIEPARVTFWARELLKHEELGAKADAALGSLLSAVNDEPHQSTLTSLLEGDHLADADKLRVLLAAPAEGATWRLIADRHQGLADDYWRKAGVDAFRLNPLDTAFMVDRLLDVGRPFAAFRALGMVIETVDPALLARVLAAMRTSGGDDVAVACPDGWHLGKALARVSDSGALSRTELAGIEFALNPLFQHSEHGTPNLDWVLANHPGDFVHLVKLIYKRDDGQVDNDKGTPEAANTAWRVLREARWLPGADAHGSIDVDAMTAWIDAARELAREAARGAITDEVIGNLLASSPVGADGHWPHEAVRQALAHVGTKDIADGFIVGKMNKRGVVWRGPGGEQERALAAEFQRAAEAMRAATPFAAQALDRLASSYEHEARRWDGDEEVNRRLGRR
ncbi:MULTISPECIES: hypothetical protein [unclassified Sphingomonas]|uniref:hypothetical protein n=1 Tax=unclassified Sphingomonas TaxID=196159 RepID=UPI000F73AC0F|nr:hypothetical protein [Sphingomonas sp. FARSPH]